MVEFPNIGINTSVDTPGWCLGIPGPFLIKSRDVLWWNVRPTATRSTTTQKNNEPRPPFIYLLLEGAVHYQISLATLEWHQYKAPVCHEGSQDKQNDTNANI